MWRRWVTAFSRIELTDKREEATDEVVQLTWWRRPEGEP